MDDIKFGQEIRKRRTELGLTLENIGDYVGVSKQSVSKWEKGIIRNIKSDKIIKLSEILNVSTDWILGFTNDNNNSSSHLNNFENISLTVEQKMELDMIISMNQGLFMKNGNKISEKDFNKLKTVLTEIYINTIEKKK